MPALNPVVEFDFTTWVTLYPEFSNCSPAQGQVWFDKANLYWKNDATNLSSLNGTLSDLLYMVTSHLAWLAAPRDANGNPSATGQPASPLVGRISSAGQGSVNVSTEYKDSGSPSEAFFLQTKYGAEFWQASAQYRTARYAAQPTIVAGPVFPGAPWRRVRRSW